jgi:hypothetical protein
MHIQAIDYAMLCAIAQGDMSHVTLVLPISPLRDVDVGGVCGARAKLTTGDTEAGVCGQM